METIHLFPHSGSAIPAELIGAIRPQVTADELAYTIEVNRDSGFEQIMDILKSRGETVFSYPYARVLTDANRLYLEHQMPEQPYRGSKLVDFSLELRQELFEKYLKPWQTQIIRTVTENPEAVIVHWHSMDTYSNGNSNISSNSNNGELRPAGQILSRVDFDRNSMIPYFPDIQGGVVENHLLSDERAVLNIFNKHLGGLSSRNPLFVADSPYKLFGTQPDGTRILGPILSCLLSHANNYQTNKQLFFEVRKDLFTNSTTTTALDTAISEIIELLN